MVLEVGTAVTFGENERNKRGHTVFNLGESVVAW